MKCYDMQWKSLIRIFIIFSIIGAVLCSGCTSTNSGMSKSSQSQIKPVVTIVNKDFSSIALTINDLPHGWLAPEKPLMNESVYFARFVKIDGSVGVPLTVIIMRENSVETAKNAFSSSKNSITDTRVDSLAIGDEAYGFQRISQTFVTFRKANLIVMINTETYPPYPIYQLESFAKIIDNKISS